MQNQIKIWLSIFLNFDYLKDSTLLSENAKYSKRSSNMSLKPFIMFNIKVL